MAGSQFRSYFSLQETVRNGRTTFRLVSDDDVMNDFFDTWAYGLTKTLKYKSIKSYCRAARLFLDYIREISEQRGELTPYVLLDALDSYESFLVFGDRSDSAIASAAAKNIGSHALEDKSVDAHFTGVNRFIDASETFRREMLELERSGYLPKGTASVIPLTTSKHIQAASEVKAAIKSNSWLAGCLSGGAKTIKRVGLSRTGQSSNVAYTDAHGGDEKAFPIDLCASLINSTACLRDKTLWSLIAASACRISEALTMQIDDIVINPDDASQNKVLIIDPDTRRQKLINFMTAAEIDKLDHKGRTTPTTYLIEPFASMFWRNLSLYVEDERQKERTRLNAITHRFLFRNLKTGAPIPLSYQSVYERFHKAALAVTGSSYGFHSLRHMSAYYLINHCPHPTRLNEFGLDIYKVQKYLGHKSIESTKIYARQDSKLLETTMAAMNMMRMQNASFSVTSVLIKHFENLIETLKSKQGAIGHD